MLSQDNFCDHFDSDCQHLESYFIKKNNLRTDFASSNITFFPVKSKYLNVKSCTISVMKKVK